MRLSNCFAIIASALVFGASCSKETTSQELNALAAQAAQQSTGLALSVCDQFAYPDSVFYPNDALATYIINPVTPLTGTFGVYPTEMKINKRTGAFDISESETGLRYMIWFVAAGTTDTCKKYITISGVNYLDSIYETKKSGTAAPVYNANTSLAVGDNNGTTEFDDGPDDDDGDGFADEPLPGLELASQGVAIDKATGNIDLKQTIANGALGVNPLSGTFKDFVLNYRVSDKSSKSLNKMALRLYYYHTKAEIPASLKRQMKIKQSEVLINQELAPAPAPVIGAVNTSITPATNKANEVKCRPPYIIIVQ